MDQEAAASFRRNVRRAAADFLGLRTAEPVYLAKVRRAAVEAGLVDGSRPSRNDRILDALAWGGGSIAPGTLPSHLEPHLAAFESGAISADELRRRVTSTLDQVRRQR